MIIQWPLAASYALDRCVSCWTCIVCALILTFCEVRPMLLRGLIILPRAVRIWLCSRVRTYAVPVGCAAEVARAVNTRH